MRVRVRGIYTTALTQRLLAAGHDVVQASASICERFETEFDGDDHDVAVETTGDRQGVGIVGTPDGVETACRVAEAVGLDTFAWTDPAPVGSVFDARVTETLGSGAVCTLGESQGFLPYTNVDTRVGVDDAVRVQVVDSTPPWTDGRPVLDTDLRAFGGLATLLLGHDGVTVDTRDDAAARELVGMTELLGVTPPDGWGVRWTHAATRADMDALREAIEAARLRAEAIEAVRDEPVGEPRRLLTPGESVWVWFGRESRFELDATRREVVTTMPGHHRIKAADESSSAAVDFVEAFCDPSGEFPFEIVTRQFGPVEGDTVAIGHGKPDGRLIVLGRGTVVDWDVDGTIAVEREMTPGGSYDALGVEREAGDIALTKFREGRWWYPTVYRAADGTRKGTYVNVCTPVECFPETIRYVDLHVDVVKHADGTVERVDDDELDDAVEVGNVS
ncbi:MAG: DUF402 domain-containing protein, partial [Halobacteriota archaeon]